MCKGSLQGVEARKKFSTSYLGYYICSLTCNLWPPNGSEGKEALTFTDI